MTATYSLTVSVTDVNDVAPNCSQKIYVATVTENMANANVISIICEDHDSTSPNNQITETSNLAGERILACLLFFLEK